MKQDIHSSKWGMLLLLDACRYDYFAKAYSKYLNGRLTKAISPASNTIEWCKRVFKTRYEDIVYVSANPYINSKTAIQGFSAKEHFYKVVDVWDFGWEKALGTVPPKQVNKAALDALSKYPNKRLIVHYVQPHFPYVTQGGFRGWSDIIQRGTKINWTLAGTRMVFSDIVKRRLKRKNLWRLRRLLGLSPKHPMEQLIAEGGEAKLREVYAKEVEFVLGYAAQLITKARNVRHIVITADHGELLGEHGEYGHHPNMHVKKLMEVPWFEASSVKSAKPAQEQVSIGDIGNVWV